MNIFKKKKQGSRVYRALLESFERDDWKQTTFGRFPRYQRAMDGLYLLSDDYPAAQGLYSLMRGAEVLISLTQEESSAIAEYMKSNPDFQSNEDRAIHFLEQTKREVEL